MSRKQRNYDDDDGRSFADMDVDGMPWFARRQARIQPGSEMQEKLSAGDRRRALLGVFIAILVVMLIFGAAFFIVILLIDRLRF